MGPESEALLTIVLLIALGALWFVLAHAMGILNQISKLSNHLFSRKQKAK